jgi:hypothetical protein
MAQQTLSNHHRRPAGIGFTLKPDNNRQILPATPNFSSQLTIDHRQMTSLKRQTAGQL